MQMDDDYVKEYFNEVSRLTAVCRNKLRGLVMNIPI